MKLKIYKSDCTDPYKNLAAEEQLTMKVEEDELILFLWQNAKTIVIGRNQNPWKECHVEQMKADKIKLARRMSGGGAVYHDLGNLNFTFIAGNELFDINKQTEVILLACRMLGIKASLTGRNDLVVDGKKFSGHAYYSSAGHNYHHGTIMLDVNQEELVKYLMVSESKLKSKGVDSVKSRVVNLKEYLPWNSRRKLVAEMEKALVKAFYRSYGEGDVSDEAELLALPEIEPAILDKYQSEAWRMGSRLTFEKSIEHRFDWGEVEVQLSMKGDTIKNCRIFSDALETEMFGRLEALLEGCKYDKESILRIKRPDGCSACFDELLQYIAFSVE